MYGEGEQLQAPRPCSHLFLEVQHRLEEVDDDGAVEVYGKQLAKTMTTVDGAARRPAPADLVPPADGPAAWRRERTPYRAAHGARKREEGHALVEEICRLVAVFVATGAWPACHRRPEFQYNFNFFLIGA